MTGNDASPLAAGRHWTLPLREASALGLRSDRSGGLELLSVDDEQFHIARAAVTGSGIEPAVLPDCVATAFGSASFADGSNFEGVAADGAGRVFVLREAQSSVVVFDPHLTGIDRIIEFRVTRPPDLRRDWDRNSNALGEGLLLLRNGHLLIAKQRKEPWLFEIGPKGDRPRGLTDRSVFPPGSEFELPDEGKPYRVLAAWPVAGADSVNDLALDGSGRLHVVSSRSACIGRLEGELTVEAGTATLQTWTLPEDVVADSKEQKAEGLVHWAGHGWLVALDLGDAQRPNLFQIQGVPG